jgi:hypothetical protein
MCSISRMVPWYGTPLFNELDAAAGSRRGRDALVSCDQDGPGQLGRGHVGGVVRGQGPAARDLRRKFLTPPRGDTEPAANEGIDVIGRKLAR